ncbi:MAG: multidrug efflux RND transporter permease subunit [Azospirillum brasilense]|nr:MAG: multidrug efflux RND transporter permease subunit [Azospirillum brasilense]
MHIANFFIDRPIFAGVLSVLILIAGLISMFVLPISEYPDLVPPQVVVSAQYPGANPKVSAETVAAPLEEQINGVEDMLYMSSQAGTDGMVMITVTFKLGTDPDKAQQLVQNRVSQALPRLPDVTRSLGVTTLKSAPDLTMVVHLVSDSDRYDLLYLRNYGLLNVKDQLTRIEGVGRVEQFGGGDYAMRVWLDPQKVAQRGLNANDVVNAIRAQNVQIAAGIIGGAPTTGEVPFELPVNTRGRLSTPEEFEDIIIKTNDRGGITRLKDVARVELGGSTYALRSLLNNKSAAAMGVFAMPGSNAIEISDNVRATMKRLQKSMPEGVTYDIVYDPTVFVRESISKVIHTLIEAILLVVLVVIIFLQTWRASLIPLLAVPVSIIGTFAVMQMFGFSINALTLFGLVLAIGIVVDDAIVVVENVERNIENGLSPREATYKAMEEVSGPIIAIALTLCAVFVPIAFISGLTGQFYKQFALTIAISTIISAFNSLTLSPALASILLKGHDAPKDKVTRVSEKIFGSIFAARRWFLAALLVWIASMILTTVLVSFVGPMGYMVKVAGVWIARVLAVIGIVMAVRFIVRGPRFGEQQGFEWFNGVFHRGSERYSGSVERSFKRKGFMLGIYAVLLVLTVVMFRIVPTGYVPGQDKQYLIAFAKLPSGASLERTEAVIRRMSDIALKHPGVANSVAFPGLSIAGFSASSNEGIVFVTLKDFHERKGGANSAGAIAGQLFGQYATIEEGFVAIFPPPPVMGLGTTGGFKLEIQDRSDLGYDKLNEVVQKVVGDAYQAGVLDQVYSGMDINVPQLEIEINRARATQLGIPLPELFSTLQVYLGSLYVNDFNKFGRTFQVIAQADAPFRSSPEQIAQLKVRNDKGQMIPLGSVVSVKQTYGPARANRYNAYRSADINGAPKGVSSGEAEAAMEDILKKNLPKGMTFEWTELTYQKILAGNTALFVFPLCVLLVFMVLSAQYESLSLPLAVILIVPMCLLCAIFGVWLMRGDNNIFTQIGLIVLVGLACKNAILIVEFARELEAQGRSVVEAAIEASRLRLRPILMTSFAFIMGVVPLVVSTGAGAEMRQAMGIAVFSGMLGVTFFGLLFTPIFYVVIRSIAKRCDKLMPHPIRDSH